jgi:hypothetical protein
MAGPDFLTVEEAARVLRIGRTAAYQAARQYRATGGAEGLPVIAIRGSLRVPRRQLELLAGGPIDLADPAPVTSLEDRRADTDAPARSRGPKRTAPSDQRPLPFTG